MEELAEASGVSIRNIRYYTAEGLLPPPDARGRYALYGEEHLRRLQFIQRLKEAYLPLPVIKARLQELTGGEISDLLGEESDEALPLAAAAPAPSDSAANYIQRVLAKRRVSESPPPVATYVSVPPEPPTETWQRITLAPGVELHVRTINDFVRQLIAYARTLGRPDS